MKISIKLKFSLAIAVLLALTVGLLSTLVLQGIERNQREQMEAELAKHSQVAGQYVRQTYVTGENRPEPLAFMASRGQRMAQNIAMLSGLQTVLYDQQGREAGSSSLAAEKMEIADTLGYALQGKLAYQTSPGGDSLLYFAPIEGESGLLGAVRFQYPLRQDREFLAQIERQFWTVGITVLLGGFLAGYGYFYRFAALIGRLRSASNRIRAGEYLEQPPVKRRDELGELGRDIYYMSTAIGDNIRSLEAEKHKLELAVQKLRELERQQKHFIGNISHEFKTPLTSIRAYIDLLGMYRDDPKLLEDAVGSIGRETARLQDMVDKVLRLSALEKYDFEQHAEPVDMLELLYDVVSRMSGKAARFDIQITTDLKPAVVLADRESLLHIMINLLDNAVKYNKPGGSIQLAAAPEDSRLRIDVTDTGTGIAADARDKIFEPFFTGGSDRSRETGGTGLGLPLVRELAEKQGGSAELTATSAGGSTFTVYLPLYKA
ncbi:sensor histidine kinase [Paenibacillus sambharensis]|uniref:histidine kinase n=1 Tax=Paenibacillus sambharensis TaxID=1803190 RepID=A0A2W1L8C9_9BACL|nr:HAMP domain-containing sensor histidine kinase [Paenibacillus sambharensis]PZD94400.1 sensor histidine kinase [Paenibacillus sambharensis]